MSGWGGMTINQIALIQARWLNPWENTWIANEELRNDIRDLAEAAIYCTAKHLNNQPIGGTNTDD